MRKLAMGAGLVCVMLSGSVFAQMNAEATMTTGSFPTKQEAYDAGYVLIDNLGQMSHSELAYALHAPEDCCLNTIELDGEKVMVEEFSVERGKTEFRTLVSVDYHYDENGND